MKNSNLAVTVLVLAMGLIVDASAVAQSMSKAEMKSARQTISDDFQAAKAACRSLSGNAKDICHGEAKGNKKIAKAVLEVRNSSTVKTRHSMRVAKAEAEYDLAKEKCDDSAGNAKDVCRKEAKSIEVAAKADAMMQMKMSDARTEANAEKLDAQYKLENEKCDKYSGKSKDNCVDHNKLLFSK